MNPKNITHAANIPGRKRERERERERESKRERERSTGRKIKCPKKKQGLDTTVALEEAPFLTSLKPQKNKGNKE